MGVETRFLGIYFVVSVSTYGSNLSARDHEISLTKILNEAEVFGGGGTCEAAGFGAMPDRERRG